MKDRYCPEFTGILSDSTYIVILDSKSSGYSPNSQIILFVLVELNRVLEGTKRFELFHRGTQPRMLLFTSRTHYHHRAEGEGIEPTTQLRATVFKTVQHHCFTFQKSG